MWVSMCAQSCPTLCDSMDCSPPGSSVHGTFQERILEWVAISSFRGSSWPRDQTHVSCVFCIGRQILCTWAPRKLWLGMVFSLCIIFISCKDHSQDLSQHQGQRDKTFEIPVPGSCPVYRETVEQEKGWSRWRSWARVLWKPERAHYLTQNINEIFISSRGVIKLQGP